MPSTRLTWRSGLCANVWFNYVASKADVADLPSRDALDEMARILRQQVPSFSLDGDRFPLVLPDCPRDIPSLWAAVEAQLPQRSARVPDRRHSRRAGRSRWRAGARPAPY